MDATIVIPVKNGGIRLAEVLDMVFRQETQYKYEVVCVDSGSTDESLDTLARFPVKLFRIPSEDFGHGRTRNFGASRGTGRYIVFITQDAVPADKHWLQYLIDGMELDAKIAGGFGQHLPYPDCNIFDARDLPIHFAQFGMENTIFFIKDREIYDNDISERLFLSFFSDNNSCLRRSVWERYPYDDVDFAEDQIWIRKMLELGYKKVYVPDSKVYHSHNFSVVEFCKRAFDTTRAYYRIHNGFKLVPNLKDAMIGCSRSIYHNEQYIWQLDTSWKFRVYWTWQNIGRTFGQFFIGYLASQYYEYPAVVQGALDRCLSQQYRQIRE